MATVIRANLSATSQLGKMMEKQRAQEASYAPKTFYEVSSPREYDIMPTVGSTEYLRMADDLTSQLKSIYSTAANSTGLDAESRMYVDSIGSMLTNTSLSEFSKNRDGYLGMLLGANDLEDKTILQGWQDSFKSFQFSRKVANRMNAFDNSEDEEEKQILLEEIDNLNNELFKLGDYKDRNAIAKGFIGAGQIASQGLNMALWTLGALGAGAVATGLTSGAGAGFNFLATGLIGSKANNVRKAGTIVGALLDTFSTERGNLSYEMYNMVDENGNRIDDTLRKNVASLAAVVTTSIEYMTFPDELSNRFFKGKAGKEIIDLSVKGVVRDIAKGAVGESTEEALQALASRIAIDSAKRLSDQKGTSEFGVDWQTTIAEGIKEASESFMEALLPSLFAGLPGNITNTALQYKAKSVNTYEYAQKMSIKEAKKLQNVDSDSTVISTEFINMKPTAPTKDYGVSSSVNKDGQQVTTQAKVDPIKVMLDPEDTSRFIPINDEEADKAKYLKNKGVKGIAVEIFQTDEDVESDLIQIGNLASYHNGSMLEGNVMSFNSEENLHSFKAQATELGFKMDGDNLVFKDTEGNQVSIPLQVDKTLTPQEQEIEDERVSNEATKGLAPDFVTQVETALENASNTKVSKRQVAMISKLAGMMGNDVMSKVAVTDLGSTSSTTQQDLQGSRGGVAFETDAEGLVRSAQIILSDKSDFTTVIHEMFHVALKVNANARKRLVSSFKTALSNNSTREQLRKFYSDHIEILEDNDIETADDVLAMLDLLDEDNAHTDQLMQEILTRTFEAFEADHSNKAIPSHLRRFFDEVSKVFKSVYKTLTGKELSTLPRVVEKAYFGFLEGNQSNVLRQGYNLTEKEINAVNFINEISTPLSQELLHQKVTEKEQEELDTLPTIKLYRSMQILDGELYSPMSSEIKGKRKDPTFLGVWYKSDENPDLAKPLLKNGKPTYYPDGRQKYVFKLEKGGKDASGKKYTDVDAAYNPYWHSSPSPLNDQFSSAYKRPNLVTVEVEVPEYELKGEYMAEKAKDSVGMKNWHTGPVSSNLAKLGNARTVMLSQFCKVNRIVPDSEVAEMISQMVKDTKISIPSNTVTPSLRAELEKLGVKIRETKEVREYNEALNSKSEILKQSELIAPNGQPSNLNEKQWHEVRTDNFKAWFGDWENDPENASKVVDENGEPLVMYHGTSAVFDVFDMTEEGEQRKQYESAWNAEYPDGTMFAVSDPSIAKMYGSNVMPLFVRIYPTIKDVKTFGEAVAEMDDNGMAFEDSFVRVISDNGKVGGIVSFHYETDVKSATDNSGEFNPLNPSILHQDILKTTLLDEGAARKKLDDFTEADVVAEVEANVFMPDSILEKYSSNPTIQKEIEDRENLVKLASDKEKLIAAQSKSIGEFISEIEKSYGDSFSEGWERLYRKLYTYMNTMTPQQMRTWFVNEYGTIDKLMELKAILSPRRIAKRQNGKIVNAVYVPKTEYVYSIIKNLNLNSTKEEIDKVVASIKKETNTWVKAYIRAKADYQKFRAFEDNSENYLRSIAEIAYLSLSSSEFALINTLRTANDDGSIAQNRKEFKALKDELKALGKEPENDETYIEAEKYFYEDELEAFKEDMDSALYELGKKNAERMKKELEEVRKKEKGKSNKKLEAVKKRHKEEMELERLKWQIRNLETRDRYEARIENLLERKNQVIKDIRIMRDLKLEERDNFWRNSKAAAILRERNWRAISEKRIVDMYTHRINNLKRRMLERELSQKYDRQIKRHLSLNLKNYDAFALDSAKYVANLIMKKNYEGMSDVEYQRYLTRTGKEGADDVVFTYVEVDENGEPILDSDNNEQLVQYVYNAGADNFSKDTIPPHLLQYLSEDTVNKLHSDGFTWGKLTVAEKGNLLDALLHVKAEAKSSMEYKRAQKVNENRNVSSKAMASLLQRDTLLTDEDREKIAQKLGMTGEEPNFEQKAQTYFAQNINEFVSPREKKNWYVGILAATIGHIQPIAYRLDGNKEGAIYDLFVNKVQIAIDKYTSAVKRRNTEATEAFDAIWNGYDTSRATKEKWFSSKYAMQTNAMDGGMNQMTGWNLLGAFLYSQNVHGFIKLISPKGNNLTIQEVARINPEYTLKMIKEDLQQREDFRAHERSRLDYHIKRGTVDKFVPHKYEGLLHPIAEAELMVLAEELESSNPQSMLPQFAQDMGNKMIELLGRYTNDMNKAAYELYNMPFTEQSRYFPLVGYINTRDVSLTEFMTSQKTVSHGFIQERKMNRDYKLLLDPMAVFFSAIEAQERMVHLTKVVNQMNSALSPKGGNLSKVLEDNYGSAVSNYFNDQLEVLAGKQYHLTQWEKVTNTLMQNLAVSKIGLNVMTSIKQFGSLITGLTDGEITIADFVRVMSTMDSKTKQELYERLAPDVAESSIELDVARIKRANTTTKFGTRLAKAQEFSMLLTQKADQAVKRGIWMASFDKHMREGMSEQDAALKATALVKRTQSISSAYDLSTIQRNKNPLTRVAFMFTNDLFQIWNRLTLGVVSDFQSKQFLKAFEKLFGTTLVAGFLGLAACGWLPDEDEEGKFDEESFFKDLMQNLAAYIPGVGIFVEDAVSGMRSGISNLPAEFVQAVRMPLKQSDEDYELEDYVDQLVDLVLEGVSFTGAPTVMADRLMKLVFPNGIDEGVDMNLGNLGYPIFGTRAGDFFHRLADEHR